MGNGYPIGLLLSRTLTPQYVTNSDKIGLRCPYNYDLSLTVLVKGLCIRTYWCLFKHWRAYSSSPSVIPGPLNIS